MRRGRKPKATPTMETMVPSKLTDEQISERGMRIAMKRVEANALKRRRKLATSEIDGQVKGLEAEIDQMAQEMVDGQEMLRQGDLFVSQGPGPDAPTPNQTAEALSDIARAAGDAPEPLPGEPHLYHASDGSEVCDVCGAEAFDPIHGVTPQFEEFPARAAGDDLAAAQAELDSEPSKVCTCDPDGEPPTFCEDHMPLSLRRARERRRNVENQEAAVAEKAN